MSQIRVNVSSAVAKGSIRKEIRNGREVMIVPSATMPADIVMNGVLYPKAVIEESYKSLDRTPAPLGHPKLNGQFLSARDPEAMNHFHIGAWNDNVNWDGQKVRLDKVVDLQVASATESGKRLLAAVEKGDPISTSTGLLAETKDEAGQGYTKVATKIWFDHDAILLDEPPAASPDQGVGMLVNGAQIPVMNYSLEPAALRELDWAGQEIVRSVERAKQSNVWEKVRGQVLELIQKAMGVETSEPKTPNPKETDMSAEQLAQLQGDLEKLTLKVNEAAPASGMEALTKAVEALTAKVDSLVAKGEAEDGAALEVAKKDVVEAGLMNEDEAKAADPLVVNALAPKARALLAAKAPEPHAAPLLRTHASAASGAAPKVEEHFV